MGVANIKRQVMMKVMKSKHLKFIFPFLEKVNFTIFHFNERMHMTHPGKEDPDHIYYVIRPRGVQEGLLSTYYFVMDRIYYAQTHGYIPYVDFDSNLCQYHIDTPVNGTTNAWEYFFKQPSDLTKEDLQRKKNVLLSGWTYHKNHNAFSLPKDFKDPHYDITEQVCQKYGQFNASIQKMADDKFHELFGDSQDVLGIFIRGTDYVALRPKGHPIQPSVEQVIAKANSWIDEKNLKNVFLVTEDYSYVEAFQKDLHTAFKVSDQDFVKNYKTNDYVSSAFQDNAYQRGLNYLIRLILLSKCQYLIASITNGSLYSQLINGHRFKKQYWFDLGLYE